MDEFTTDSGIVVMEKAQTNGHKDLAEVVEGLRSDVSRAENNVELYKESLAELELSLEDTGWQRISGFGDREFSFSGLRKLRRLARLNYLKNPLIRHAVDVQAHYVWGQGVTVSANNDNVNNTIQAFLEDPKNINIFSGHMARLMLEVELRVESDLFFAFFTNQNSGRVVVRRFVPDEINDIITNPDDYMEPWFYKRVWTSKEFSFTSASQITESHVTYYPDWRLLYNTDPDVPKPAKIGDDPVEWNTPVYHVKVGGFGDQKNGCPEIYPALDWARAVKDDLEDYATLRRAHSRFAWKQQVKGGRAGVQAAKTKLGTTMNEGGTGRIENNPPSVSGSTLINAEGWDMNPIKTAGMIPNPEEGRRLWLMVSAGTGIPETILSGNADVGNLATAKTLDRPTELQMENRRQLWTDIYIDVLNYVIDMAIKCPNGMLKGEEVTNTYTGLVSYELDGDGDREIEIRFPSILRHDILPLIQSIVWAITLNGKANAGLIDDSTAAAMLFSALGETDYDDTIAAMFPNDEFRFNAGLAPPPGAGAGQQPLPLQCVQSSTDKGLGKMGGAPLNQQQGSSFDSFLGTDMGIWASKRFRESLKKSLGSTRSRSGSNRSGITYKKMRGEQTEMKVSGGTR